MSASGDRAPGSITEDGGAGALGSGTVSILVVTHRDLALLERALEVCNGMPGIETIIVNNDPAEDVRRWAQDRFPDAVVIEMGFDAGYARAMNVGIDASRGEFVLLLDSDLFLSPTYISEMLSFFAAHPGAGAAGGKLLRYDLEAERETPFIDTAGVRLGRNRRVTGRGEGQRDEGQYDRAEQLFGVDGAGMFLRRSALNHAALDGEYFDSSFFMHKEDTDLCWRLRLLGWEIWYVPRAVGAHGRTTRGLGDRSYLAAISAFHRNEQGKREAVRLHAAKNQWLLLTKNEDRQNFVKDLPFILGRELGVLAYNAVFAPKTLMAVRDYARLLRPTIRKRRLIRQRRLVQAAEIRSWLLTDPTGTGRS